MDCKEVIPCKCQELFPPGKHRTAHKQLSNINIHETEL